MWIPGNLHAAIFLHTPWTSLKNHCPETIVLKDIPDTPTALAYLFGLLYSLNMEFPKDIRYTFETIQHIFMEMSTNCSQRVRSFKTKLLNQWFIFHGEDLFYPVCSFIMFVYFVNLHIDHLIVFMLFLLISPTYWHVPYFLSTQVLYLN